MRVLQITAYSGWGCTGRIAVGIHNALINQNQECAIAWGRINTAADTVTTIKIGNKLDQNVHGLYTRITDKCGFGSQTVTRKFLKEIDEYAPDLIQLHIMHGYYINLEILFEYIKKKNIPVVWTFHDCWAFTGHCPYFDLIHCEKWKTGCYDCEQKRHHPTSLIFDNSKWNWEKKKELFTEIPDLAIVTPSKWLAGLVRQSFFKGCRIEVINNGINLNDFKPTTGTITDKLQIGNRKVILGVSSTWAKSKGLNDFIQLASLLPKMYVIVLVGLAKQQKEELPNTIIGIERTDSIKELAELYTVASVFVNPTYEDNYPTTNLEALACGTPVLTYRTGGSVEAAGSEYGKIVDQGNVNQLAEYIVSRKWESVTSEMCREKAKEFDENIKFNEYVELYKELIKKRNGE